MEASAARYARWKAPAEDGQILVWPQPADLLADARSNHVSLAGDNSVLVQQVPLPEVRRKMRQWLGHDDDQLLFATGHQTELHHPGVWAKNALIDAAAVRSGGRAFHFAVDTDEPKHLMLRWPGGSVPLTDDSSAARSEWSGLVAPPTPAHLANVEATTARAATNWNFKPVLPEFLNSLRRQSLVSSNLPGLLTECLHELDWSLGLRYDAMIVSPLCLSEPYLLFVHHLLGNADAFGADYNASLEAFRRQNRITAPGRPMPNLKLSSESCEVPFWLDVLSTGTRSRATVQRSGDQWALRLTDENEFRFDPAANGWDAAGRFSLWLRKNGLRLAPRALTLTAVLRLLVADQFAHGIGGGQYDRVLDTLIAKHFGVESPRFCVTTATLYFPDAVGQPRVCLPCIQQQGHRLKHGILGEEKRQLVEQIAGLPRLSIERSNAFYDMHDKLAAASNAPRMKSWEAELRQAEEQSQMERVLFDRELFYAIQPGERLSGLIDQHRRQFA
jgi:hypothetical protein